MHMVGQASVPPSEEVQEAFNAVFPQGRVRSDVSLGPMTTFRTGGPADWFLETSEADDVTKAMVTSQQLRLPVTLLGGGSNVLVGGRGVRGLVIRLRYGKIRETQAGRVRVDAGVSLNGLVRWMVSRGWAGLERWAGTPGTVGGAIHGNAHFRGHLIGDQITRVGLIRGDRRGVRGGSRMTCSLDTTQAACSTAVRPPCGRTLTSALGSRRPSGRPLESRWRIVRAHSLSHREVPAAFFGIQVRRPMMCQTTSRRLPEH